MALPTITGVAVAGGGPIALEGGTSVVITGTNFNNGNVTNVSFSGTAATSFVINSGTQITAVAPAKAGRNVDDITVTNPSGTSAVSGADQVSYATSPTTAHAAVAFDEGPTNLAAGPFTLKLIALGLFPTAILPMQADYPVLQFLGLGTPAQYAAGGGVSLL